MSKPNLPPEILDRIIDFHNYDPETLMECCLVSKSWVPRARMHLFARIRFRDRNDLELWNTMFPDPTNSPGWYTHTLAVGALGDVGESSRGMQAFPRLEQLIVSCEWANSATAKHTISLIPFHKFAPSLKHLNVSGPHIPAPQIVDIVRSLPLLEDLLLSGSDIDGQLDGLPAIAPPSTPLTLTGTLDILVSSRIARTLGRVLELPGGLHFQKIQLSLCYAQDIPLVTELVTACSDTLESLDITCKIDGALHPDPLVNQSLTRTSSSG